MTIQARRQPRVKVCYNSHIILTAMARLQGISGGLSGKTGSYTFRQSRGETIVSQYQPIVKNPNTPAQQSQRAKFKLMSQLAAIMAPGFGTMGVTKRPGKQAPTQRNAFVQLNMPLVEVDSSADNEVVAKIPMEKLKLTSSFRTIPAFDVTGVDGYIALETTQLATDIRTVRLVTVGYVDNVAVIVDIRDVPSAEFNGTVRIDVPAGKYTVLAYGLIPSASAMASIDLDNIHTPADENFISAIELNTMVAAGVMAVTMTTGNNVEVETVK